MKQTISTTPIKWTLFGNSRISWAILDLRRFDLALSCVTTREGNDVRAQFGAMHPVLGPSGRTLEIRVPTWAHLKFKIRIFLKHLDPRPAYTYFSGTDCDHSTGEYVNRYACHYLAFKAMKSACDGWDEGPCGWHFISKKEYETFEY